MRLIDKKHAAAACAALLLTACGGGDGDDTAMSGMDLPTGGVPPAVTEPVGATFFPADPGVAAYSPVGDFDIDSFGFLNRQRRELGMPAVTRNSSVSLAAAAHSNYQVVNNTAGHFEDPTKQGYTGVSPQDRVSARYTTNFVGEVLVFWTGEYSQTTAPAHLLFDAPFHRLAILTSGTAAGSGYASGTGTPRSHAWTWDIVDYRESLAAGQVLVYPYPGQAAAPYSWINNEIPNPLPSRPDLSLVTVGYPVTMQIRDGDTLDVAAFSISDSTGTILPCEKLDHTNNADTRDNFAVCTPYAPLKGDENYVVAVNGSINGSNFSLSWAFSTIANQLTIESYDSRDTAAPPVFIPDPDGPFLERLD